MCTRSCTVGTPVYSNTSQKNIATKFWWNPAQAVVYLQLQNPRGWKPLLGLSSTELIAPMLSLDFVSSLLIEVPYWGAYWRPKLCQSSFRRLEVGFWCWCPRRPMSITFLPFIYPCFGAQDSGLKWICCLARAISCSGRIDTNPCFHKTSNITLFTAPPTSLHRRRRGDRCSIPSVLNSVVTNRGIPISPKAISWLPSRYCDNTTESAAKSAL